MKEKRTFYCELAYAIGLVVLAFGTALMERAEFGMSMVVAPAYVLHLKISQVLPFFSFGMSQYVFQAVLLIVLSVVTRRVKKSYFLSFVTAFIYGLVLDLVIGVVALLPLEGLFRQILSFVFGLCICSTGVALLFRTYLPPEAYELFVKELSQKHGWPLGKTKTVYDCCSCALGVLLSLCFFGAFVGVYWGTVISAVVNGWLIGRIDRLLGSRFSFKDALPLRNRIH